VAGVGALGLAVSATGCLGVTSQLHPTDIRALEQLEDFDERNQAYNDNAIYRRSDARGTRYVKGQRMGARPRSWQSLDLILRSDRNSAAALPEKKIRTARVLTGLLVASGIVLLGGIAASAREGLDLTRLNGTGAILLAGGASAVGFGIASGVVWGQAKAGYEDAVPLYNDSLSLRLGITDADGNFKVPDNLLIDEDGFMILDQKELLVPELQQGPVPAPVPALVPAPPAEPEPAPEEPASEGPAPLDEQPPNRAVGPATAGLVGPSRGAP